MPVPVVPIIAGALLVIKGGIALVADNWKKAVTTLIPGLLGKLLSGVVNAGAWTILWIWGVRIGMFGLVYGWFTDLLQAKVGPLIIKAVGVVPSVYTEPIYRACQFADATDFLFPWEDLLAAIKWIILIKLFLLTWHLADWAVSKVMKLISFQAG